MTIADKVLDAALAGLLHDIGKFSLRASRAGNERADEETRSRIRFEHALATHAFVQQFIPEAWRAGLSGAAYHHNPTFVPELWVQLADRMSLKEEEQDEDRRTPYLQSVFSNVDDFLTPSRWPLGRLDYTDRKAIFPIATEPPEWKEDDQRKHAHMWDRFERECRRRGLTKDSRLSKTAHLENLAAVLQEFTWSIPATHSKEARDVSLFDHLRTAAALAACLAADERDEVWCNDGREDLLAGRPSKPAALLVGGDFSGIQDFIYTLSSGGAAKSLRARSFYLQLLGEVIALNVLDGLALPPTNLLYVGGGGFQLLVPIRAESDLPALEQALAGKLMEAHRGALGLTLAWVPVRADEFEQFGEIRERVGQGLNRKKQRPFAQVSASQLAEQVGSPLNLGGDPLEFCRVTGDDWDVRKDKRGEYKTGFVLSLEELGQKLPFATHLVLAQASPSTGRPRTWQEGLNLFGYRAIVVSEKEALPDLGRLKGLIRVWRLDPRRFRREEELLNAFGPDAEVALSERPIAKLAPLDKSGELLTFDELAEESKGITRWGVLRLDVDNLGRIFRNGLGKNASLSRIASLSFGLRLFFEGWLPELAEDELKGKLYIQYAGGDDVFVVGAWDVLPEFALRLRKAFREFTGGNPAFTLSGGIAIVEAKYPLYQAARLAGEAEEAAKSLRRADGRSKDAITFLDRTSDWKEFEVALADARRLAEWSEKKWTPKSLLQVILALYQQMTMAKRLARQAGRPKPQYGRWMWMAAYQLTRVAKATKVEDVEKVVRQIQDSFLKPGAEAERWGLAARWAHYLVRGGE